MTDLLIKVSFPFLVMETLVGMVANGSIILINFIDWFRRRKLSPTDLVLTCLGISRLLVQTVVLVDVVVFILLKNTLGDLLFMVLGVWLFTHTVNLWFAACLSVFYLAKIAIFSNPVFLQVKQRFSGLLPWLLLGSVVFSAIMTTIIIASGINGISTCNPNKSLSRNRRDAGMNLPQICNHTFALIAIFDFFPFMVFLLSSIFLISSLWKHMRRMQQNGTSTQDLNTQAHLSSIKALASFAVLYLINFAAFISQSILTWNNEYTWAIVVFNVSAVYPIGHAILLILINPKLKEAWVRILQHFNCGSSCKMSGSFKLTPKKNGGA